MTNTISIAIEGLCCVGKTSLTHCLLKEVAGTSVIPEVILQGPPQNATSFRGFYYRNDLQKELQLRELESASNVVVIDRYYVSTLSHFAAVRQLLFSTRTDIESELRMLHAAHYAAVRQPTCWVFLRSDATRSWERYRRLRSIDKQSLWGSCQGTALIARAMEACIRDRDICAGTVLILDADTGVAQHVEQIRRVFGV